jgi:3',5'-cyclic AMP phosphodiesterase CpdA
MPPKQEPPDEAPHVSDAKRDKAAPTRQVDIIHLSDLHFGEWHCFNPKTGPDGTALKGSSKISLADKLAEDLAAPAESARGEKAPPPSTPVVLCATGDFAEGGAFEEFSQAQLFLQHALTRFPGVRSNDAVFLVAGNHDVPYEEQDLGKRWQQYINFYNDFYDVKVRNTEPWEMDQVHDRIDDLGVVVACVNSSIYVCKGSADEQRGQVDDRQLDTLEEQLKQLKKEGTARWDSAIRIALIHHHPVLIPSLVEPGRNYDAVVESGRLISLLKRYGFHLLLHGHKHHPHVFTEDVRNAFVKSDASPMLVVAGGSVGSTGLPKHGVNCYNRITVKWHPAAGQARVHLVTRELVTHDPNKEELNKSKWHWTTLWEDDISFIRNGSAVRPKKGAELYLPFDGIARSAQEKLRKAKYHESRQNMAVAEVRPSMWPGQAYEATVWIVPHRADTAGWEAPKRVIWSAGNKFQTVTIERQDDPCFCTTFDYWGPMLVQAELIFDEGPNACAYVYARIPGAG